MCEAERGSVGLIRKAHETVRCLNSMVIHYVIQQQVLCRACLNLHVVELVVAVGSFMCSYRLNHNRLYELLSGVEAEYLDLSYHTAV